MTHCLLSSLSDDGDGDDNDDSDEKDDDDDDKLLCLIIRNMTHCPFSSLFDETLPKKSWKGPWYVILREEEANIS